MERLLEFYALGWDTARMSENTLALFGKTMDELIYEWQLHLLEGRQIHEIRLGPWWRVDVEAVLSGASNNL